MKNRYVKIQKPDVVREAKKKIRTCLHCNDPCWRADVNYCWECYKYQKFESR
ncbi:hypothetical protein SAMN02910292_02871 [Lachnospiraceae bacterium XBB2008]|nr:hypothetical protein SAMN02910292_02871 [Lachnospiraceae bacterium XBB2008]